MGTLRECNIDETWHGHGRQITRKKAAGEEILRNLIKQGSKGVSMVLTVDTTAVPNLAYRRKRAGKSIPLSQIRAPPVMDPDSGLTSKSVGVGSGSVLGGTIAWWGVLSESKLGPAFRGR